MLSLCLSVCLSLSLCLFLSLCMYFTLCLSSRRVLCSFFSCCSLCNSFRYNALVIRCRQTERHTEREREKGCYLGSGVVEEVREEDEEVFEEDHNHVYRWFRSDAL